MAKQRVETSDIIQKGIFDSAIKDTKDLIIVLDALKKNLSETATAFKTISGNTSTGSTKSVNELMNAYKGSTAAQKEYLRISKLQSEADSKVIKLMQEEAKLLQQEETLKQKQLRTQAQINSQKEKTAKALEKERKATELLNNKYVQLTKQTNEAQFKFKSLAAQFGVNSKKAKEAEKAFLELDNRLRSINERAKDGRRDVGRYGTAFNNVAGSLKNIASAFGVFTGIQLVANTLRDAVQTFRQFQLENARLAGLLNTNAEGIKELTEDAKRLGSETSKTASEVTALQQAYARLGFSQKEILDLTGATINGSVALNASLDETAELTGAVVRTFDDFGTQDAAKILDQLTLSTQKSALNFEKLQTALPIVAGAANTAGVSFTELLSLLGKLSDSGIDASSSATALRNIFIESAAQGLSYEEILDKIVNSQDKLTAANDEFGKRAAVSATVLSKNIKGIKELDEALQGAAGTAKKFADETLDTLDGDIKLLTSAWEGLILSVTEGDGVFNKAFRGVVQFSTQFLNNLKNIDLQLKVSAGGFRNLGKNDFKNFIQFFTIGDKTINEFLKETGFELDNLKKSYKGIQAEFGEQNGIKFFLSEETNRLKFINEKREELFKALVKEGESKEEARKFADRYIELLIEESKEVENSKNAIIEKANVQEENTDNLTGLIEKQRSEIKRLNEEIEKSQKVGRVGIEGSIRDLQKDLEIANKELDRLLGRKKKGKKKEEVKSFAEDTRRVLEDTFQSELDFIEEQTKIEGETRKEQIKSVGEFNKIQRDAEENKAEERKRRARVEIEDAELLAATLEQIEVEKNQAFERIAIEGANTIDQINEDFDEKEKRRLKERADLLDAIFGEIVKGINRKLDNDLNNIDKRISNIEERRSQLEEAAAQGSKDAIEARVLEEKEKAKLELKAEKKRREQIQIEAGLTAIRIGGRIASEGRPVADALKDVGAIQALTSAIISGVPAFFEGTEDTGTVNNALDANGGRIAILHDNERVMTKEQNKKVSGLSNEELANVGQWYNSGQLVNVADMNYTRPKHVIERPSFELGLHFKELIKEVKELPNKMPKQSLYYNEREKAMYDIVDTRFNRNVKKHSIKGGVFS